MVLLSPQPGPLPVGPPSAAAAAFWDGAKVGQLRYPRCSACGRADFPAAPHCRFCLEDTLVWETSKGLGTVYSYTIVWRSVTPDFVVPYAPAVVELDEGYSMMTNLIGLDTADVAVDLRVVVDFADAGGLVLPYFRPHSAFSSALSSALSSAS